MKEVLSQRSPKGAIFVFSVLASFFLTLAIFTASIAPAYSIPVKIETKEAQDPPLDGAIPPLSRYNGINTLETMRPRDMSCLASAIWHEAGNQPMEGKIAVAEVILARTRSKRYPDRPCAVIAQPSQFSFVKHGVIPAVPMKHRAEAMDIAEGVVSGELRSRVHGAMWFHADYVDPGWNLPRVGQIGTHIFYGKRV